MNMDALSQLFKRIVDITATHVSRGGRQQLRNERYFHHMFSFLAGLPCWPDPEGAWQTLHLRPEEPTRTLFRFNRLNLANARRTAQDAVGKGIPGLIDFALTFPQQPRVLVEWKGPKIYTEREIVQVLLKLLSEPAPDVKVLAAIFTSGATNRRDHRQTIVARFNEGLNFAQQVLQVEDGPANLYAYIATLPDSGVIRLHSGQVTEPLRNPSFNCS